MIVSLIVAIPKNLAIGKNNKLIWNLPEDMKFFMETTTGHPVIMGRKNFESIPEKYRPLKNRTNVIITRNKDYDAKGCIVVNTIEDSLKFLSEHKDDEIFVIGGGEVYRRFLEKNLINLNRQFLHAGTIGFIHPKKDKEMIFNSILPQELEIILKTLRNTGK